MRINEISRRGFLGQLGRAAGAAAVTAAVPSIALAGPSEPKANRDPAMRREIDRLRADRDRMRGNWSQVQNAARSLGLDPNKVRGKFDGQGNLVAIIDERNGREVAVSSR